jgi:hypothetical protein
MQDRGDSSLPKDFTLTERLAGFPAHVATATEKTMIIYGDLVTADDPVRVQQVLEGLQQSLFSRIPGFPDPSQAKLIVILIHRDLTGTAYINELSYKAHVQVTRPVELGDPVYVSDMTDIQEIKLGIDVPDDVAVVAVASLGWRRSVYFDFAPLIEKMRIGPLSQILARQMLSLLGVGADSISRQIRSQVDAMADGYQELRRLLSKECGSEVKYQELLENHPWMDARWRLFIDPPARQI